MDMNQLSREKVINGVLFILFVIQLYQGVTISNINMRLAASSAKVTGVAPLATEVVPGVQNNDGETKPSLADAKTRKDTFLNAIRNVNGEITLVGPDTLTLMTKQYPDFSKVDFSDPGAVPIPTLTTKTVVIKIDSKTIFSGINGITALKKGDVVAVNTREPLTTSSVLHAATVGYFKAAEMPPGFEQ